MAPRGPFGLPFFATNFTKRKSAGDDWAAPRAQTARLHVTELTYPPISNT